MHESNKASTGITPTSITMGCLTMIVGMLGLAGTYFYATGSSLQQTVNINAQPIFQTSFRIIVIWIVMVVLTPTIIRITWPVLQKYWDKRFLPEPGKKTLKLYPSKGHQVFYLNDKEYVIADSRMTVLFPLLLFAPKIMLLGLFTSLLLSVFSLWTTPLAIVSAVIGWLTLVLWCSIAIKHAQLNWVRIHSPTFVVFHEEADEIITPEIKSPSLLRFVIPSGQLWHIESTPLSQLGESELAVDPEDLSEVNIRTPWFHDIFASWLAGDGVACLQFEAEGKNDVVFLKYLPEAASIESTIKKAIAEAKRLAQDPARMNRQTLAAEKQLRVKNALLKGLGTPDFDAEANRQQAALITQQLNQLTDSDEDFWELDVWHPEQSLLHRDSPPPAGLGLVDTHSEASDNQPSPITIPLTTSRDDQALDMPDLDENLF